MVTCAEEGCHAVQGAVLHPLQALRADDIQLDCLDRRERGVVPDGVDDDVGDGIERADSFACSCFCYQKNLVVLFVSVGLIGYLHPLRRYCKNILF
jgi:hypothetical protein